ncbi:MAG: hypothetical protein PHX72_00385 [Candidatus Shapirobacteria bacterium]|nr:hypothetical protein [Candidatus Shapirobacteria bacterium]
MSNDRNGGWITAALFGALAGAAAVILLNEDTRKKVHQKIDQTVKTGGKEIDRLKSEIEDLKVKLQDRAAKELAKASKKLTR